MGSVLSRNGTTTRNRGHASHAQNNTVPADSINKAITKLIRSDLILVDDVGLLPVSADAADTLFRVVDAAYETPIAISSNVHPSGLTS